MAVPASPAPSSFASASTYRSLEGLLRERKLDRTLTSTFPDRLAPEGVAPFGLATLDARILGKQDGRRRYHARYCLYDAAAGWDAGVV